LPENARVLRIGGNDVLILMRVLVDGAADLPAVHALQDQFRLAPLSAPAQPAPLWSSAPPPKDQAARRFVWLINEMLARNPPPAYEKPLLDAFASVGVCGAACSWEKLPASTQALWERMLPELKTQLNAMTRQGLQGGGGWSATPAAMGRFGTNYCLRAGVALAFLLALEPVEAIYPSTSVDQRRQQFDGAHAYRLHLPPGGLPVEAFWSLTMYQVEADGRMYLADNSIQRYAVGDRTPGLKWNADGSLDLWIQRDNPGADKAANWLPTPEGVFALVLRAYQPKADLRDGRFALPVVERLD
ncbi:MAG: DUF1214 domain-containing protein, partial [Candidatus Protistobacter heckmanni]|nr:DUF1214 domain-containing protein [Candidatus Protistobacter heckmanni]